MSYESQPLSLIREATQWYGNSVSDHKNMCRCFGHVVSLYFLGRSLEEEDGGQHVRHSHIADVYVYTTTKLVLDTCSTGRVHIYGQCL